MREGTYLVLIVRMPPSLELINDKHPWDRIDSLVNYSVM
jgi:hypothetical protein